MCITSIITCISRLLMMPQLCQTWSLCCPDMVIDEEKLGYSVVPDMGISTPEAWSWSVTCAQRAGRLLETSHPASGKGNWKGGLCSSIVAFAASRVATTKGACIDGFLGNALLASRRSLLKPFVLDVDFRYILRPWSITNSFRTNRGPVRAS